MQEIGKDALCVVVPCHNEEASISGFVAALKSVEAELEGYICSPISFVFVDDGSTDATLDMLRTLSREDPFVHYISLSRNFGKEAAMYAGLEMAVTLPQITRVALMDADLQDPPGLLREMFLKMQETSCDVVAAYRRNRAGEPRLRSCFARAFYRISNRFTDTKIRDGARDFRLMRINVARAVLSASERTRFTKGLFSWVGFKTEWVEYENIERKRGESSWSFRALTRYAIDGILSFSAVPLEIISGLGLLVFAVSVVFFVFIFVRALIFGDPVAGWPSLACLIALLSGVQLLCLGIVGLYVSKIYAEVKRRPLFYIRERDGQATDD